MMRLSCHLKARGLGPHPSLAHLRGGRAFSERQFLTPSDNSLYKEAVRLNQGLRLGRQETLNSTPTPSQKMGRGDRVAGLTDAHEG